MTLVTMLLTGGGMEQYISFQRGKVSCKPSSSLILFTFCLLREDFLTIWLIFSVFILFEMVY
jgi:hypothetical protein